MHQTIQNLNMKVANNYNIQINVSQSLVLDHYEEGEIEEVEYIPCIDKRNLHANSSNISNTLNGHLNNIMNEIAGYDRLKDYFNYLDDSDDSIIVLRSVTSERILPTKEQIELWRKGEFELFNEYSHINIKINGVKVGTGLIKQILEIDAK